MLKGTTKPISEEYGLALLDLDGVVYLGKSPVDYAAESIDGAQRRGMRVEYTTNNSSRFQATVAEQLQGFGLDVGPDQVITSSVVAARMVAHRIPKGAKVLVVGAEHLREEVRRQGLVPVDSALDEPAAVIQGWYPEISWHELAQAAFAVEHGARYLVTNRDMTLPRELGVAPGAGSLIAAVVAATGVEPEDSAGKPESAMYDEARLLAASAGEPAVAKDNCLAIGDRLDTDIEAGNKGGYDSFAVLTGVCDAEQLLRAPSHLRPTYVAGDLRALNEPMPAPCRTSRDEWRCGTGCARLEGREVRVDDAESVDALRAACNLVWCLTDEEGVDVSTLRLPVFSL